MKKIALVDGSVDSSLIRDSVVINHLFGYWMVADSGFDFLIQLSQEKRLPDIAFINVNLLLIDGIALTHYIHQHYPSIKVIGFSNEHSEEIIRQVLYAGASGFVIRSNLKTLMIHAAEMVIDNGIYLDEQINLGKDFANRILSIHKKINTQKNDFGLTEREKTFVILNATALSYDQIARIMFIERKSLDTYFDRVSKKLNITSRQALAIFSIQNRLAKIAVY